MFNQINISENDFKRILNGCGCNSFNNGFCSCDNIFSVKNSDIWKNIKNFEIGVIIDEISDYFNLSKTIEHFVKNFTIQNGFFRFKNINECEYFQIVCVNNEELLFEICDKLKLSGFNFLFKEKYTKNLLFLCFKRGEEKITFDNFFYIEDRGKQPKVKRDGLPLEFEDGCLVNKRTFYYTLPNQEELNNYKNYCFGFNIYEIELKEIQNLIFCTSFEDNNKLYIINDIPKELIILKEKHKNYV